MCDPFHCLVLVTSTLELLWHRRLCLRSLYHCRENHLTIFRLFFLLTPRFMKLPNAVKCIQFCDHQINDAKPAFSSDFKQPSFQRPRPHQAHHVSSSSSSATTSQPPPMESASRGETTTTTTTANEPEGVGVEKTTRAAPESLVQHQIGPQGAYSQRNLSANNMSMLSRVSLYVCSSVLSSPLLPFVS